MLCKNRQRIDYVDISKGVGLILVVLSHTVAYELMKFASGFYVPIFFVCAGYTYRKSENFHEIVKKRMVKLMKPYFFFNILLLICFMHFSLRDFVGLLYSRYCLYLPEVVPNIKFLTSGNYPLWFLTCMSVSYILFYILVFNERFCAYIILFYLVLTGILDKLPILLPWSIDTAFIMAILMYVGKYLKEKGIIVSDCRVYLYSRFLFFLLLYVFAMLFEGEMNISIRIYGRSFLLYLLTAIFGCVMLLYFSIIIEKSYAGRLFLLLGNHSLTIFCIEIPFVYYSGMCFDMLFDQGSLRYYILIKGIFQLFVAIVGGYACSLFFNRFSAVRKLIT